MNNQLIDIGCKGVSNWSVTISYDWHKREKQRGSDALCR